MEASVQAPFLVQIVRIHQDDLAASASSSSDSPDEVIEAPQAISFEQLPNDLTGQLLAEMDAAVLHSGTAPLQGFFNRRALDETPNQPPSPRP